MKRKGNGLRYLPVLLALIFGASCDKGLAPPPPETRSTINGRVTFHGAFPPCDSSHILAVVLSQDPEPFTPVQIINGLNKTFFPFTLDSCSFRDTNYVITVKPGTYRYLGVAQFFGTDLSKDWRVVGYAHTDEDSAMIFNMMPNDTIRNIELWVRFDSLPRQPFVQ
jgi:hypothetical protein